MKQSTICAQIDEYLSSQFVLMKVAGGGTGLVRDGWECDGWQITIARVGVAVSVCTMYYTGLGHRIKTKFGETIPRAPDSAAILHSLLMDASCGEMGFAQFCDELGYSNDSISAFNSYQECQKIALKFRTIFTREHIDTLSEMLADY